MLRKGFAPEVEPGPEMPLLPVTPWLEDVRESLAACALSAAVSAYGLVAPLTWSTPD